MRIQYVSKYLQLAEEGLVPRLECPMDQGLLMSNLDWEDKIYLYCSSCSYKKHIGIDFYQKIKSQVEKE
jgi:hypothetical protein